MKRILIYTALLLTIVAQGAWAGVYDFTTNYNPTTISPKPTEGPWTLDAADCDAGHGYVAPYNATRFNEMNHNAWQTHASGTYDKIAYQQQGTNGLLFILYSRNAIESHFGVMSTYKHEETIPAYTRIKMTWNFQLRAKSSLFNQAIILYARDNMDSLKNTPVTFRHKYTGYECPAGQPYYIAHLETSNEDHTTKTENTDILTHEFYFDNSAGSIDTIKSWNLLMVFVTACWSNDDYEKYQYDCKQEGAFKNISYAFSDTCYFKQVTYYANGGEGEMDPQTIETSGKLSANAFTREGFHFTGWATSADGTVVYADEETITASESDKGLVNLYAKWTSTPADAMALINKIPNPIFATEECHKPIVTARSVYNFLNGTEQAQVTNAATLLNAEAAYDVAVLIDAIGTVVNTAECKTKIAAARSNYNALTADQKAMVGNYSTLTTAEASYAVLFAKGKIAAIGEVTLESKAAIDAARAAFEVLTEAEEAQITAVELETLLAAEAAYAALAKSTIEFKGKDGASDISSKQEAIYYPEIPAGYHWQTEQNDNVSTDKTIVIKAVNND